MRIHVTKPLFAWDVLEDSPSLKTIREFLEAIPDDRLLAGLRATRAKGRNDYPVRVLWGTLLLGLALRHPTVESCLAELRRNEGLRRLIGIETEEQVPNNWNMSRFLQLLGQQLHRDELVRIFNSLIQQLGVAVPTLGQHTAVDSTTLNARHDRRVRDQVKEEGQRVVQDRDGLPVASGGRKEYRDDNGQVSKILQWFGYEGHLLVDVEHEVILARQITSTKTPDNEMVDPLIQQAKANLPEGRIETMAYDKAVDDHEIRELLRDEDIKPVIQIRNCWQNQTEKLVTG